MGRIRARAEVVLGDPVSVVPEYVELVDPDTLEPVDLLDRPARLLIAARVGEARLIDNVLLEPAGVATGSNGTHATTTGAPR